MYTSAYRPRGIPHTLDSRALCATYLQHAPMIDRLYRAYLPLYASAFASLDVREHDLVLASSSGWAHRLALNTDAPVVVYCHNPPRFLWQTNSYLQYENRPKQLTTALGGRLLSSLRRTDLEAASRVRVYLANSRTVAARIAAVYNRRAEIVPPPIEANRFTPAAQEDFALVVSRLQPYKRVDLAIAACNELGLPLRIVGDGAARATLQRSAGKTVAFLGRLSDSDVASLMGRARLLIVAAEEDFGLTALEANAAGCPVVAYRAGGALETVVDGITGVLFERQTPQSIAHALQNATTTNWNRDRIVAHAQRFDVSGFQERIAQICARTLATT